MSLTYITLGANATSSFGGPLFTLKSALERLNNRSVRVIRVSRFYSSSAFPVGSGPDFVNGAAALETDLAPIDLLARLHAVEAEFGRVRDRRWGPRVLDLDVAAIGDQVLPDMETYIHWRDLALDAQMHKAPQHLILPHPRLQDRAFALIPLRDVAPDWVHPVLGQTIAQLLGALPDAQKADVQPL